MSTNTKKKNSSVLIIIVIFSIIGVIAALGSQFSILSAHIEKGRLTLNKQQMDESIIKLDGQWEFYPFSFKNADFNDPVYIDVPGSWRGLKTEQGIMNKYGYGTYRLVMSLPEKGEYALRCQYITAAYKIFINGREITKTGEIGKDRGSERTSWYQKVIPFYADQKEVEIILQVSNFHCYGNGIEESMSFGTYSRMYQYYTVSLIKESVLVGIFLGFAFYINLLNRSIHEKRAAFHLGAFCMGVVVLDIILNGGIIFSLIPTLSCESAIRLEQLAFVIQLASMQCFIYSLYRDIYRKEYLQVITGVDLFYGLLVLTTPNWVYAYNYMPYISLYLINMIFYIIVSIKAMKRRKKYVGFLFVGMLTMGIGGLIEILCVNNIFISNLLSDNNFYILGGLIFIICQSCVLSLKVEEAYSKSQHAYEMEVAFLQAQISPHFFFNAMNNVYCLMDTNLPKARHLLMSFCNFLRAKYRFDYREAVLCTLEDEVELIRSYVEIERIRLNDQVTLEVEIEESLMSYMVLPLILQPLVENAIKHGFDTKPLLIKIRAEEGKENIHFTVSDNGKGMGEERILQILDGSDRSLGIGIKNINFRLYRCYRSHLTIKSKMGEGTEVSFDIPRSDSCECSHY